MTMRQTKGERTRQKLVETTGTLLRRQGYHATGLAEIVAESGAPRGSLYFHFPGGKDELACAAVLAAGSEWRARLDSTIAEAVDLGSAVDAIICLLADDLEASGWDHGCPVAGVALESPSEPVRRAVADHYTRWTDGIADRLAAFGLAPGVAQELSAVILCSLEGALLLARVTRNREPLITVGRSLRVMVEAASRQASRSMAIPGTCA